MLVKLTQDLKNGFAPWKEMLHVNGDKVTEHGITVIFSGYARKEIICLY